MCLIGLLLTFQNCRHSKLFISCQPMSLSDCMAISLIGNVGLLVYIGHKGQLYEIIGGEKGQINLKELG